MTSIIEEVLLVLSILSQGISASLIEAPACLEVCLKRAFTSYLEENESNLESIFFMRFMLHHTQHPVDPGVKVLYALLYVGMRHDTVSLGCIDCGSGDRLVKFVESIIYILATRELAIVGLQFRK